MAENNMQIDIQKQAKKVGFTYLATTRIGFVNDFLVKAGLHNPETLLILSDSGN